MRTIADIKKEMTDVFISNDDIIAKYGLEKGKTFEEQFSKVSIESILFYIFAASQWLREKLFEQHQADVSEILRTQRPHTPNWYAEKAKLFQYGPTLGNDSDVYNNSEKTEEKIKEEQIIKYCAVAESKDKSILYLKIAGETPDGQKTPIDSQQYTAFKNYINRVSDAGVRIMIINEPADPIRLNIDLYFDPLIFNSAGKRLDNGSDPVREAVRNYLSNLPFNGEYANVALIDVLQNIEGVIIPELQSAEYYYSYYGWQKINARQIAYSGYYQVADKNLFIQWIPYESAV